MILVDGSNYSASDGHWVASLGSSHKLWPFCLLKGSEGCAQGATDGAVLCQALSSNAGSLWSCRCVTQGARLSRAQRFWLRGQAAETGPSCASCKDKIKTYQNQNHTSLSFTKCTP